MSLDDLNKKITEAFSAETSQKIIAFRNELLKIPNVIRDVSDGVENLGRPIKLLGEGFSDSSKSFEVFNKLMDDLAFKASKAMDGVSSDVSAGIFSMVTAFTETNKALKELGESLDGNVENFVKYRDDMYDLGSQFGMTFEESKKMGVELAEITKNTPDDLIIGFSELQNVVENTASGYSGLGLTLDNLNEKIETSTGAFNSLNTVILLSRRSGEGQREVIQSVTKAITGQGATLEGAISQYSQFIETARETGTSVKFVQNTLEGAVSGFNKMGISADFARPLLDGFAKSLEKTNLGIANASSLTQTLSRAFGDIASSYDKSFILSQVGGMNTGGVGGGVLSPSIELRQRIRDAKETGSQAEIGLEMAEALKKTLESFGGGEIVTLEDAASDPSRENFFKMQEDLLAQYGISGDAAVNTLDMLKELSDVTVGGSEEIKNKLGEQLAEQLDKQDQNALYQERISKSSENIFASSVLTNKYLDKLVDISLQGGKMIAGGQSAAMRTTANVGDLLVNQAGKTIEDFQSRAKGELDMLSSQSRQLQGANFASLPLGSGQAMEEKANEIKSILSDAVYNISLDFSNYTIKSKTSSTHVDPVGNP